MPPNSKKMRFLFTDASDEHWAAIWTQILVHKKSWSLLSQEHEPLAFLTGSFCVGSQRWFMTDKNHLPSYKLVQSSAFLVE